MVAISETHICNLALRKVGAETISSRNDNSNNAKICNDFFDQVRDDILTDHPWRFAQERATLVQLATEPLFDFTINYAKPADCLKVNFTNIRFARFRIEGDIILANDSGLKIIFTKRITDPVKFFPKFVVAFATRLAAEIAIPLAESRTLAADLLTLYYEKQLPQAMSVDSQQGTPLGAQQNAWADARHVGPAAMDGTHDTSVCCWFPC